MHEGIEASTKDYVDKSLKEDLANIKSTYLTSNKPRAGNFWVAHREGSSEVLGMVGLECLNEKEGELRRMSVSRAARRLHVGSLLLTHLLTFAKAQGYEKCVLSTLSRMMPGRKLYEKHGFVLVKEETVSTAPLIVVVYYELPLDSYSP